MEATHMQEAFAAWDQDGSGNIERDELSRVLKALNPDFKDRDIAHLIKQIDKNAAEHRQNRLAYLEEGRKLRKEITKEKAHLERIKERKVQERLIEMAASERGLPIEEAVDLRLPAWPREDCDL